MKKSHINKICIIFNPFSGKGGAEKNAKKLQSLLLDQGFELIEFLNVKNLPPKSEIRKIFSSSDLVIISGGDGTLRSFLSDLSFTGRPVYFIPSGNESLFAKEFLMSSNSNKILKSIEKGMFDDHYIVSANKDYFFTMLSIGFDSQVIKEFSDRRRGVISHKDYFIPTLLAIRKFKAPKVSLIGDGKLLINKSKGFFIVSNNPQYALGVNFVPEASSKDEFLYARFFECSSAYKNIFLCFKYLFFNPQLFNDNNLFKASKFHIELDEDFPVQVDGDIFMGREMKIELQKKKKIKILVP